MELIDTHCHLYDQRFSDDLGEVIARAAEAGVTRFYLPAVDSESTFRMMNLETAHPGVCFSMIGLHPCSVKEDYHEEMNKVDHWLSIRDFAAIGEIGLDLYWDKQLFGLQQEAFRKQMEWALERHLPIVIHSRDATAQTISMVKPFAARGLRGIFHCFGGSASDASEITAMGFLLGIGGVITYKNSGLAAALASVPLEFLVLETDAPYLAPVPYRGKRNEPSYLLHIAEALATAKGCSVEEIASATTENAKRIFGK